MKVSSSTSIATPISLMSGYTSAARSRRCTSKSVENSLKHLVVFLFLNFIVFKTAATEVEHVVTYQSNSETGNIIATSSEDIISRYNQIKAAKFSACMAEMSSQMFGSCSLEHASNNQPTSMFNDVPTNWTQTRTTTVHNKSYGVTKTIITQDTIRLYGMNIYCPRGTYTRVGGLKSSCVIEEAPNHCTVHGNPINYLSGEKIQEETDFVAKTGLAVKRRYINQWEGWEFEKANRLHDRTSRFSDVDNSVKGKCDGYSTTVTLRKPNLDGNNSTDTFDVSYHYCARYIKPIDGSEAVILGSADGTRHDFYAVGDYYYSSLYHARLEPIDPATNNGSAWLLRFKSGEREYFDKWGLLKKSSSNGFTFVNYYYDADHLVRKEDSSGSVIRFEYDNGKRIRRIYLPDNRYISYEYLNPPSSEVFLIKSVTYSDGLSKSYVYEDPNNPLALTGLIDEHGRRFSSWSYDVQGRAISSERHGGVDRFTFDYSKLSQTTVTNPLGKRTTYTYLVVNGKKVVANVDGIASDNCGASNKSYEYFPNGLVKHKTDWKGIKTTYQYNALGQETSRTEAFGTTEARTITTEWHPALFVKTKVTEAGKQTVYSYDTNGRLLNKIIHAL